MVVDILLIHSIIEKRRNRGKFVEKRKNLRFWLEANYKEAYIRSGSRQAGDNNKRGAVSSELMALETEICQMELSLSIQSTAIKSNRTVTLWEGGRKSFQAFSVLCVLEAIFHNMFPFGVILSVKAEADLLIKLDRVRIVFIHAKIHGVALIL